MVGASLIGRDRELAVLAGMLADRAVPLVTVTGPAGVGRTRVAYAVAGATAEDSSSRHVPGLSAEHMFPLAPLALPERGELNATFLARTGTTEFLTAERPAARLRHLTGSRTAPPEPGGAVTGAGAVSPPPSAVSPTIMSETRVRCGR